MPLALGTRLGAFEVIAPLGSGGMGDVYRARDWNLHRDVALKVLPDSVVGDSDRIARFEREARAVAALSHPNILAIYHFGNDNGVRYAVTELLEGQTLRAVLRGGTPSINKAVAISTQIVRGLEAAHARGIIHRDLKPENVFLLDDGQVKILDFGLAKRESATAGRGTTADDSASAATATALAVTQAGMVMGSAGYMSPEQIRGEPVDHRSDLFSFGCVFYEMIAGRRAFAGDSAIDAMVATLHADPPDLATINNVAPSLARIVSRCLDKTLAGRFQSAADLRRALETVADAPTPAASPHAMPQLARRRRVPLGILGVATVLVMTVAYAAWYWTAAGSPTEASPPAALEARGIAVLPFDNLGDAEQAYFSAGVTEEVTLQLAKISALRVMSRNAVARFKDPSAQLAEMTRELNIGAVLTGSVRHAGSQVRVGVQLLAAPSGETLWSEQYDRTVTNIFDVQSDIAVRVAGALQASLAPAERARIERLPTHNMEAYELYLKQRPLATTVLAQNEQGLQLLDQAIALDPSFALAHAVRSRRLNFQGDTTGRDAYVAAVAAARRAVGLDPQLARGHYALGMALFKIGQIEEARGAMQRAVDLDSSYFTALADFGIMELNAGRPDRALYWARRVMPLAPNLATSYYQLALPITFFDANAAERFVTAAARRFPTTDPTGGHFLQSVLAVIDLRRGKAVAAFERMRAVETAHPSNAGVRALVDELAVYADAADAAARLDAAVKTSPERRGWWAPYTPRTLRAHLFVRAGEPERARPLIDAALASVRRSIDKGDRSFAPLWEEAALQIMLGNRGAAVALFEKTIDAGSIEPEFPKVDPLLAGIRQEPRFVAAVARIARIVAEMRQRADLSGLDALLPSEPTHATSPSSVPGR